jgi:hypothetical protein
MDNQLIITNDMELGKVFAESGLFPDIKSASQGFIKILAGKELGLSPIQSLNSFFFVNGKIGISAQTMGALVKKSGKYDYKIISHDENQCTLEFFRLGEKNESLGQSTFTIKDAARAGIVNGAAWKNYPKNMVFARALMNGVRWFCPDSVSAFLYTVEELQDIQPEKTTTTITMDANGEVSNGEKA